MNYDDFVHTGESQGVVFQKGGMLNSPLCGRLKDVATRKFYF